MPRSRPAYPLEFRQKLIELMRAGRSPEQLAQEFEPTAQTIRNWVAQADADGGKRPDVLTNVEREELGRLRKETRKLRIEREILAKAAAWFARVHRRLVQPEPASLQTRPDLANRVRAASFTAPRARGDLGAKPSTETGQLQRHTIR